MCLSGKILRCQNICRLITNALLRVSEQSQFSRGSVEESWYFFGSLYFSLSTTAGGNLQSSPTETDCLPLGLLRLERADLKTALCKFTGSSFKSFDQISAIWCHLDTCASVAKIEMHNVIDHLPSACIYSTVKSNLSLAPLQYHSKSLCFSFLIFF